MSNVASGRENNTLLTAALTYANYGWSVFPCRVGESPEDPKDKAPYTARGLLDATRDERQIRAWWAEHPDAAIGVACGASNLVVLDYDPRHDLDSAGWQRLKGLLNGHETRQAETGRGGLHFYFRSPPGDAVRNSAGALGAGVDIRGDGGYVLAPPSLNAVGPYVWLNNEKIQPLPVSIPAALAVASPVKDRISRERADGATTIPDGRRHQTLMSMAGTMRWRGMSPLAIEKAILAENEEHCEPPLPEEDALRMARDAGNYEAGALVFPPERPDTAPQARVLADDSVAVQVQLASEEMATFTFTEMEKDKRELSCHLSLVFMGSRTPYQQRINLESSSARTELRRDLDAIYGKERGWAAALSDVWWLARETYLNQDRSMGASEIPLVLEESELIDPLMPSEGLTILFGDGGSLKSYVALGLGAASATATTVARRYRPLPCRVLYIDYEDSASNWRRRLHRVCAGAGIPVPPDDTFRHYAAKGIPLRDQAKAVKDVCDLWGIDWLILDSIAPACGRAPEEAEAAVVLANALGKIGLPCLAIAHVVKNKTGNREYADKPFGTVFWSNLARRTWFVTRDSGDGDVARLGLYCKKINDGAKPPPIGFLIRFDSKHGPVTVEPCDINSEPELVQHTGLDNQIWAALEHAMTVKEIAEAVDRRVDAVQSVLRRHSGRFIELGAQPAATGRPSKLWGRAAVPQSEENPF